MLFSEHSNEAQSPIHGKVGAAILRPERVASGDRECPLPEGIRLGAGVRM